jgi:predicted S18 family serine protease
MRKIIIFFILNLVFGRVVQIEVPAVSEDFQGKIAKIEIALEDGDGDIYWTLGPIAGKDTQISIQQACKCAESYTGQKLSGYDVKIKMLRDVKMVEGPSAGSAICLALISCLLDTELKKKVYITGYVEENGSIRPVGGLYEKAVAIKNASGGLFLIPYDSQELDHWDMDVVEENNSLKILKIVESADIYLKKKLNIDVIKVKTIAEAVSFFIVKPTFFSLAFTQLAIFFCGGVIIFCLYILYKIRRMELRNRYSWSDQRDTEV